MKRTFASIDNFKVRIKMLRDNISLQYEGDVYSLLGLYGRLKLFDKTKMDNDLKDGYEWLNKVVGCLNKDEVTRAVEFFNVDSFIRLWTNAIRSKNNLLIEHLLEAFEDYGFIIHFVRDMDITDEDCMDDYNETARMILNNKSIMPIIKNWAEFNRGMLDKNSDVENSPIAYLLNI